MCRKEDIITKIQSRVEITHLGFEISGVPDPCHIWQGPNSGDGRGGGYPRISLDGQTVAVHLVVYTHHFGFIPGKKQIDHRCNNRLCVNKDHLQMVTHKKNQALRAKRTKRKTDHHEQTTSLHVASIDDECLLRDHAYSSIASSRGIPTEERRLHGLH